MLQGGARGRLSGHKRSKSLSGHVHSRARPAGRHDAGGRSHHWRPGRPPAPVGRVGVRALGPASVTTNTLLTLPSHGEGYRPLSAHRLSWSQWSQTAPFRGQRGAPGTPAGRTRAGGWWRDRGPRGATPTPSAAPGRHTCGYSGDLSGHLCGGAHTPCASCGQRPVAWDAAGPSNHTWGPLCKRHPVNSEAKGRLDSRAADVGDVAPDCTRPSPTQRAEARRGCSRRVVVLGRPVRQTPSVCFPR